MKKLLTLFAALLVMGSMSIVQADTWTVAGSNTTIFGTSWNPENSANDMTLSGGLYVFSKNVNFSYDASIEFKVCQNHGWNTAYPSNNYEYTVPSSAKYLIITYKNDNSHAVNAYAYTSMTVAGSSEAIFGTTWAPSNTANDMTLDGGVYTFKKEHVTLSGGIVELKACDNHGWDNAWPGENYQLSIPKDGEYTITITFDPAAQTVNATAESEEMPVVKMYGTFADGSSWGDTQEFTIAGNKESASLEIKNLPAGDYEFKVVLDGSDWRGNGYTYHRDYTGAANIGAGDNMKIEADVTGDYTFTWTYANNALNIGFPAEPEPEYVNVKLFAPREETSKWEHVYAYSYKGSRQFLGDFPGAEITNTKDAGWYTVSVRKGSNLVFSDGNGMQVYDIMDIQADVCYVPTSIDHTENRVSVAVDADCKTDYYIAGSKTLVGGETDFDTNLPLDENNQIVFHNVAPGTYAFKINNGTWAWSIGGIDHMKEGDCATIAKEVGIGDLGFITDIIQDVTVTYYPETQEICLGAVTVKETPTISIDDIAIKAGESKRIAYVTNNSEDPDVAYVLESGLENIRLFKGVLTGIKLGEATVRVSLAETEHYAEVSTTFTIAISAPVAPATAIEEIGGKFIINAKGDTAVFSRGNLTYNVVTGEWYCADRQYDFVGEGGNLHFGDDAYQGEFDLFGWSCESSNYGLLQSNHDEVYTGEFVDWGGLFAGGEKEWSSLKGNEMSYIINHHKWTVLVLDPTIEDAENEDEIYGVALFPHDWVQPAGFESLHYSLCDWNDSLKYVDNTFPLASWSTLEAAGAVFLPMAGARAGHWGNTWNGKEESTRKNPNPNGGNSYCFVDNVGWYGYYWSSTTDPRAEHPYDAQYLIFPGWSEGPTTADDDDLYLPPVVWSREKRRGNSVRLVTLSPRQYTITYTINGAEGTIPTDEAKYLDGAAVTLASAAGLHKEGFAFTGWMFKGTVYNAEETYTIANVLANEEIVFEAQWEYDWQAVRENLNAGEYYTMCLDKAVADVRGASIWRVVSKAENGTDIILEEVANPLDAGRPYIFYATATTLEVLYTGNPVNGPLNDAANNGLIGSFEKAQVTADAENYIIYNNALYYVNSANVYVGANRAYLNMGNVPAYSNAPQQGAPRRRVTMAVHGEQTTTGMENVQGDNVQCTKVLINGQLFILRGEKMYDANGQVVK